MPSKETDDSRQGIQSVEIAMTVLLALEQGRGPMNLTQVAAASGMAASKVHRYLVSLGRAGLVAQSPSSGLYDLGPSMRRLGMESLRRMDEVGVISEYLPGLRDRTSHAVNLAVWGDHGPIIVRWDYGSYALPMTIRIGSTMPLATSSVGRVFLAHLPATLTDPVLRNEVLVGSQAPMSAAELKRIKAAVSRDGVAITTNAIIPGITSVAAPVFSAAAPLPLVIAFALPAAQATDTEIASVSQELLRTSAAISADLGGSGRVG